MRGDLDAAARTLRGGHPDVGHRTAARGRSTELHGRNAVLCEAERSDADALAAVERVFRTLKSRSLHGSRRTRPARGLRVAYLPRTSFALALTVLEKERGSGISSTWRAAVSRVPRLAKRRRDMGADLLRNKYNVLDVLREHIHQLQIMRKMIERDDAEGLTSAFEKANSIQRIH